MEYKTYAGICKYLEKTEEVMEFLELQVRPN